MYVLRKLRNMGYILPVLTTLYAGCDISCSKETEQDTRFVVGRQDAGSEVLPVGYIHKEKIQEKRPKGYRIASCTPEDVERSARRLEIIEQQLELKRRQEAGDIRLNSPIDGGLEQRTQDK